MYFTKQHELVRKLAREFAEKELTNEILDEVEESGTFPEDILYKMGKAGFSALRRQRNTEVQGVTPAVTCW